MALSERYTNSEVTSSVQLIGELLRRLRAEVAEILDEALARAKIHSPSPPPVATPRYITIQQARKELGNCGNAYIYKLLNTGVIRSVSLGRRKRLIDSESIRDLLREAGPPPSATEHAATMRERRRAARRLRRKNRI